MKSKIFVIFLALLLLLCGQNNSVKVFAQELDVTVSDSFWIDINVEVTGSMTGLGFHLRYDPDVLEYVSWDHSPFSIKQCALNEPGRLIIALDENEGEPFRVDLTAIAIQFRALPISADSVETSLLFENKNATLDGVFIESEFIDGVCSIFRINYVIVKIRKRGE